MAYARPTALLSPGDIFPEIPFSVGVAPLRIARRSGWNPPAGRGTADFRRIYTLPQDAAGLQNEEHYAELRKITSIGVQYFLDARESRIATLTIDTLNEMYSQVLWSLTRAELFFRPVRCPSCDHQVPIDV